MKLLRTYLPCVILLLPSGCSALCGLICTEPALPTTAFYAENSALLGDLEKYYRADTSLPPQVLEGKLEEIKGQIDFSARAQNK